MHNVIQFSNATLALLPINKEATSNKKPVGSTRRFKSACTTGEKVRGAACSERPRDSDGKWSLFVTL